MYVKNKNTKPSNDGRTYIGAKVPLELKARLERRAKRERRSVAAIIELTLTRELATEA